MRIVRTYRAIEGIREVATYVAKTFGKKALKEFRERLADCTKTIKAHPGAGTIDWEVSSSECQYLKILVYRRSWMEYRVDGETIYIVDFYDTRKSVSPERQLE